MRGWNCDGEANIKAAVAVKIGEVSAMARSQRYKSVCVRLQHSVWGSFVPPLCRVERMEGLVLAGRRWPSLGRQEICAVGRLDDDMEAMCGDVLVSFDGDRKPPTQRDGSKSASRRVGVPASAARLRRCPDPDCRLGSLRFV